MTDKLVIIINPLILHNRLCSALAESGINIMAVYSIPQPKSNYYKINPEYFVHTEILKHDLKQDVAKIKMLLGDYQLVSVIPGFETDYQYSEELAHALCPQHSNDPNNAHLRYRKYEMNAALKCAGLNYIPQIRFHVSKPIDTISDLNFPVVIKPSYQAAGSIGVKACRNLNEMKTHLQRLKECVDGFGNPLDCNIVIQEKVVGTEYFADSVSWGGKHYITSIYKYHKVNLNGKLIYRYMQFIRPEDSIWPLCHDYAQKTLDALNMNYGCAHTEFMVTKENKPYLMEINPRLSGLGGEINRLCKLLTDYDQSDVYIQLLNDNKDTPPFQLQRKQQHNHARILFLFSWQVQKFKGFNQAILSKLQTHKQVYRQFKPEGTLLTLPETLFDVVVTISLIDKDIDNVIADTEYLQELEQKGLLFNS